MVTYYYTSFEQGDGLIETILIDPGEGPIHVYGRVPGYDKWARGANITRDQLLGVEHPDDNLITKARAADLGFVLSEFEGSDPLVLSEEQIEEAKKLAKDLIDPTEGGSTSATTAQTSKPSSVTTAQVSVPSSANEVGSGRQWNIAVILGAMMGVFLALE